MLLCVGIGWAGLILWLLSRAIRQFRAYEAMPLETSAGTGSDPLPSTTVTVIVPARDEEHDIGRCLAGLSAQTGMADRLSIVVVDDGSRDGTAEVVRSRRAVDPRIGMIAAGALPDGWAGKTHACWRGAADAAGAWLCFVDADVVASPELMTTALRTAEIRGIDMLSLQPFQELGSFWERLIMPAGLLMIACAKDLRGIEDPASSEAAANGQFILIRRDVYFAVGGHAAVRAEICEDKALAGRVKQAGFRLRVAGAEHLARTRMYTDLASLWEGFAKNAVEIMGGAGSTLLVAAVGVVLGWSALLLPTAVGIAAIERPSGAAIAGLAAALLGSLVVLGVEVGTMRHFRVPAAFALLFPLGFTSAGLLAAHSAWLRRRGTVRWKGRRYAPGGCVSDHRRQ